jgi:hemerythrin-like domain-containing protein
MRSEPRLLELSSDHHEVLVVIEQIRLRLASGDSGEELGRFVGQKYDLHLSPHFKVEEEYLLPELTSKTMSELVRRTLAEHELLRGLVKDARLGKWDALRALADVLEAHIRFEEREVYPAIEAKASNEALEHVARLEVVPEA